MTQVTQKRFKNKNNDELLFFTHKQTDRYRYANHQKTYANLFPKRFSILMQPCNPIQN